jgi:hypothetical protein
VFTGAEPDVHAVDAAWALNERAVVHTENTTFGAEQAKREAL